MEMPKETSAKLDMSLDEIVNKEAMNKEQNVGKNNEKKTVNLKKNRKKISLKKSQKKILTSKNCQKIHSKVSPKFSINNVKTSVVCPPPPPPPPLPTSPKESPMNWNFRKIPNLNPNPNHLTPNHVTNPNLNQFNHLNNNPPSHNPNINIKTTNVNLSCISNCNMHMSNNVHSNLYYSSNSKKNYKISNIGEDSTNLLTTPTLRPAPYQQNNNPININVEKKNSFATNNFLHQNNNEYSYTNVQQQYNSYNKKISFSPNIKPNYSNIPSHSNSKYYLLKPSCDIALSKPSQNHLRPNEFNENKIFTNYQNDVNENNIPKYFQPRNFVNESNINIWGNNLNMPLPNNTHDNNIVNAKYPIYDQNIDKIKYNKYKVTRMNNSTYAKKPHNIIVTNIPKNLTSREILETFRCMGNVLRADIMLTSNGEHSGCACITFADLESASLAASRYDGGTLNKQKIKVFVE